MMRYLLVILLAAICYLDAHAQEKSTAWKRHTIDGSSRGADGVRLADVNGDGLTDITTGWEEGGVIRAYLHPGLKKADEAWPAVTVGKVRSPEDAVFVDLDGDGAVDVVSSCEGRTRTMYVHWAPRDKDRYLDAQAWKTEAIPVTAGKQSWMFAMPMQIDGRDGVDLIVSSKGRGASIGWLQSPKNPRDLSAWKYHRLYDAGWIMSLVASDVDGDGDTDVVASDRKGKGRGVLWLENPGTKAVAGGAKWAEHRVGGAGREVMFLDVADLDGDGLKEIIVPIKNTEVHVFRRSRKNAENWSTQIIRLPAEPIGRAKGIHVADLNLDGRQDLIFSCEGANKPKSGVVWLSYRDKPTDERWQLHDISGPAGIKFDILKTIDMDGDGDLDVLTCEERDNLGVFWYENPTR
jgi:hypothetical protein